MTDKVLERANKLDKRIRELDFYLKYYAKPSASCHRIRIIPRLKKIIASNFMGNKEYELDAEEFEIVNKALSEQLQKYKEEFDNLNCESLGKERE